MVLRVETESEAKASWGSRSCERTVFWALGDRTLTKPIFRGVHPSKANDAFPPCFRFSPISDNFSESKKHFPVSPFFNKILSLSTKNSHDFFSISWVIHSKFVTFHPISTEFIHFLPISQKTQFSPIFTFPLFLFNLCLLPSLRVLSSPCFDHDAFMHHAIHLLDTPAYINWGEQKVRF